MYIYIYLMKKKRKKKIWCRTELGYCPMKVYCDCRGTGHAGAQAHGMARGTRRCDTAAWGCDTAGGPGHYTTPVHAWARLCAPRRVGWVVCAHYALDSFLTQYCF